MQQIHPTKTSRIGDIVLALVFALCLFCAYALAQRSDEEADAELQRLAAIERAELSRRVQVSQAQRSLSAYEAGLTDAMEAMRDTPQGVQLAQACMALQHNSAGAR